MKLELKEGIYYDVNPTDYHNLSTAVYEDENGKKIQYTIASKSTLTKFAKNAEKFRHGIKHAKSKSMDEGNILDCMLLTPKLLAGSFYLKPSNAPRRPSDRQINAKKPSEDTIKAIEWWKNHEIQSAGKMEVTADEMMNIKQAVKNLKKNKEVARILKYSKKQVVVIKKIKGIWVKCMIDILPIEGSGYEEHIIDLKRTSHFEPWLFNAIAKKFKYDWQAAFYTKLFNSVSGENRKIWSFIISDSNFPFSCATPPLDEQDKQDAEQEIMNQLDRYITCIKTDTWPSPYDEGQPKVIKTKYRKKDDSKESKDLKKDPNEKEN